MKKQIIFPNLTLLFLFTLLLQFIVTITLSAEEKPKEVSLSYSMNAQGSNFSNTSFDRGYVEYEGELVRQDVASTSMSIMNTNNNFTVSTSQETTLTKDGKIILYTALFEENKDKTEIRAYPQDGWLVLEGKTGEGDFATWNSIKESDYDLSVAHIPLDDLELTDEIQVRHILDLYSGTVKDNKMKFLGKESLTVDEKIFECDIVAFDYGEIKGTMWIAKDELGYFLVKEDAKSEIGDFQMILDTYTVKGKEKKDEEFGF